MRWSLDPQGALTHADRNWKRFTGLGDDRIIGTLPSPAVHPDDQQVAAFIIQSAVEARAPFLVTFRLRRADESYSWVMAGGAPAFAPATGNLLGYLGSTEPLRAVPDPPRVTDVLHRVPQQARHTVVMLDAMADHVMAARNIAKHADDLSVKKILDYALLSIGDLIYKAAHSSDRVERQER